MRAECASIGNKFYMLEKLMDYLSGITPTEIYVSFPYRLEIEIELDDGEKDEERLIVFNAIENVTENTFDDVKNMENVIDSPTSEHFRNESEINNSPVSEHFENKSENTETSMTDSMNSPVLLNVSENQNGTEFINDRNDAEYSEENALKYEENIKEVDQKSNKFLASNRKPLLRKHKFGKYGEQNKDEKQFQTSRRKEERQKSPKNKLNDKKTAKNINAKGTDEKRANKASDGKKFEELRTELEIKTNKQCKTSNQSDQLASEVISTSENIEIVAEKKSQKINSVEHKKGRKNSRTVHSRVSSPDRPKTPSISEEKSRFTSKDDSSDPEKSYTEFGPSKVANENAKTVGRTISSKKELGPKCEMQLKNETMIAFDALMASDNNEKRTDEEITIDADKAVVASENKLIITNSIPGTKKQSICFISLQNSKCFMFYLSNQK